MTTDPAAAAAVTATQVEFNVPAHWNEFLPRPAKEKQDALAVLIEATRNPELTLQCLEHGWDGLRKLRKARQVVTKALPLMEAMRRAELQNNGNAATGVGGSSDSDLDEDDDAAADPDSDGVGGPDRIPFRPSVQRLRKARAESSRLRSMERKTQREVDRITKERETIDQALKECQRLRDGFDAKLAQKRAMINKCSADATKLEQDQQAVKQALTQQAVSLFSNLAGIELLRNGRPDRACRGATALAQIDSAHTTVISRLEPQRTVTRTALRAGLFQHGSFVADQGVRGHVARRIRESGSGNHHQHSGSSSSESVEGEDVEPARVPDPALDKYLDEVQDRRSNEMLNILRRSGKEPRGGYQPQDQKVETWKGLRNVMRRYHQGEPIPPLLLEPDGKKGAPINSCWWERFVEFWTTEVAEPFDGRMHTIARRYLLDWRELCMVEEEEEEEEKADDGDAQREGVDSMASLLPVLTGGAGGSADSPGSRGSSDSEQERVRQFDACAERMCGQLRQMLDNGTVVGPSAEFVRAFLDAAPEQRDLEGLLHTLQRVDGPPSLMPAIVAEAATPPPPPPPTQTKPKPKPKPKTTPAPETAPPPPPQPPQPLPSPPSSKRPQHHRQPQGHAKGWVHGWAVELEQAVTKDQVADGDRQALTTMANRFVNLVFSKRQSTSRSRSRYLRQYEWVSERVGYMVNFLINVHNTAYLRRTQSHRNGRIASRATVEERIRRYEKLKELVDRMRKFMKSARMKSIEGSKSVVDFPSNYIHRDMWVADFPLCSLQQALTPGGAEQANVAKPFDYTMGGWACLRCVTMLKQRHGDCDCRCFRGHRRTECARSGQCYGFHPTRFMEMISLGLPRDPTQYKLQHPVGAGGICTTAPTNSSSNSSSSSSSSTTTSSCAAEKDWKAVMREDLFPDDDDDDEEDQDGDDDITGSLSSESDSALSSSSSSSSASLSSGAMAAAPPRKKKAPPMAFHKRTWTSRQRWRFWRECIKDMAEEGDPWYGVVPESERDPSYLGLVDSMAPLLEDWFNRAQAPRKGRSRRRGRRRRRSSVPRTRYLARFHLDIMLDKTKWDPERCKQHPPNWGGPSWRWISGSCPLCSMPMESNHNEHCRGLCSGCRAWKSIDIPEKRMIALKGSPYEQFARGGGSAGAAGKKRKQKTKPATRRGTKRPRRLAPATKIVKAPVPVPTPKRRCRQRRSRPSGSAIGAALLREWFKAAAPSPPPTAAPALPSKRKRARPRPRPLTAFLLLGQPPPASPTTKRIRGSSVPSPSSSPVRRHPRRARRRALRHGAFLAMMPSSDKRR